LPFSIKLIYDSIMFGMTLNNNQLKHKMDTHPTIEAFIRKFSPCRQNASFARSCQTLDVAERYANGQACDIEALKEARKSAHAAYDCAFADVACATCAADAADAVTYAVSDAAYETTVATADYGAAYEAIATYEAADAVIIARENQAKRLRTNTRPNFERALRP